MPRVGKYARSMQDWDQRWIPPCRCFLNLAVLAQVFRQGFRQAQIWGWTRLSIWGWTRVSICPRCSLLPCSEAEERKQRLFSEIFSDYDEPLYEKTHCYRSFNKVTVLLVGETD